MKNRKATAVALLAVVLACATVDVAAAQQFQPINNAVNSVLQFLTGTFATTSATLAVAAVAFDVRRRATIRVEHAE